MGRSRLAIITFNVQGTPSSSPSTYHRLREIGKALNCDSADIINFQEVFTNKHLEVLSNTLTNFPYVSYKKHIIGPRGGLVTFSKMPVKLTRYKPYSSVVFFRPSLIRQFFRNLLTGKGMLLTELLNSGFVVINTHLSANRGGDWSIQSKYSPLHTRQMNELSEYVNSVKEKDFVVFSGDLNVPKTSKYYTDLVINTKAFDLFQQYDYPTFRKEFLFKNEEGNRLDFIFLKTSKSFGVRNRRDLFTESTIDKKVNRGFVSDHLGLGATISTD